MSGRRPRCRRGRRASALHSTQGAASAIDWVSPAQRRVIVGALAEQCAQVVKEADVNHGLENRASMVRIDGLKEKPMLCVGHDCELRCSV